MRTDIGGREEGCRMSDVGGRKSALGTADVLCPMSGMGGRMSEIGYREKKMEIGGRRSDVRNALGTADV